MRFGTTSTMWTVSVGTSFALHLALAVALSLVVATQVTEQVQQTQISFSTMDLLPAAADPIPLSQAEALPPVDVAAETSELVVAEAAEPPPVADAVEPPSAEALAETPEAVRAEEVTAEAIEPATAEVAAISEPAQAMDVTAESAVTPVGPTEMVAGVEPEMASAVQSTEADPIAEMIAAADAAPTATVLATEQFEAAPAVEAGIAPTADSEPAELAASGVAATASAIEGGEADVIAEMIAAAEAEPSNSVTATEQPETAITPEALVVPPSADTGAVEVAADVQPLPSTTATLAIAPQPASTPQVASPSVASQQTVVSTTNEAQQSARPSTQTVAAVSAPLASSTATVTATTTVAATPLQSATPSATQVTAQPQVVQGIEAIEPVEVADVPDDGLVVTIPPVEAEIEEPPDPGPRNASLGAVVDYIAGYRSPSCFAAYAREEPDGTVKVSAYSADAAAEAGMRDTMAAAVDGEVAMQMNQLSEAQCGVLKFARGVPGYPATDIGVDLASSRIANGDPLAVTIDTKGAPYTYVLVVDDEGSIGEVRRFEQPDTEVVSFEQAITLQGGGASAVQLLVVVTSSVPLDTQTFYGELAKGTADRYFNELIFETVMRERMDESVFDVAITEFVVE